MNDQEIKVNVLSKEGAVKVLTGRNFVELHEFSSAEFITTSISDFAAYVKNNLPNDWPIYVSEIGCKIYNPVDICRYTMPSASLRLSFSSYIESFRQKINQAIHIARFEKFLLSMLDFADTEAISLYDFCRNLDIKSITSIRRAVDNQGNYTFSISRNAGDDQKLPIPEEVQFLIPIFKNISSEKAPFRFRVSLDYETGKDGANVTLQLMNYTWDDDVMNTCKEVISRYLKDLPNPKYWGNRQIHTQTDEWKYESK